MKNIKLRNFIILIRFILLSITLSSIYLLVWHFIIKAINNEDVTFWSKVIFAIIGFNLTYYYEQSINMGRFARFISGENVRISYSFHINFILKIILTPIAIPLFISTYLCDLITDYIYKDEEKNKTTPINNYINIPKKNYNTDLHDDDLFKEEYYCEMCFKKITEEEFEKYDCMCEECFEAEHFDNM